MAGTAEDPIELPSGWTYRTAHQIYERLNRETSGTDETVASEAQKKAQPNPAPLRQFAGLSEKPISTIS